MKILIDTGVVLDAIAARVPFAASAQEILLLATSKQLQGAITSFTVSDIYHLSLNRLQDSTQAMEILRRLFVVLSIVAVDSAICHKALDLGLHDYDDAILVASAIKYKANYLVTRTIPHFISLPVPVISPEDFLRMRLS